MQTSFLKRLQLLNGLCTLGLQACFPSQSYPFLPFTLQFANLGLSLNANFSR